MNCAIKVDNELYKKKKFCKIFDGIYENGFGKKFVFLFFILKKKIQKFYKRKVLLLNTIKSYMNESKSIEFSNFCRNSHYIRKVLQNFKTVERVKIQNSEINLININEIVSDFAKLKTIEYSNCKFQIDLLTSRYFNNKITCLGLNEMNFTNREFAKISRMDLKSLKSLDISQNKINDEDLKVIARLNLPILEELNFSDNEITSDGIKNFFIEGNFSHILRLNLAINNLCGELIMNLSLCKMLFLEHLNLSGNHRIKSKLSSLSSFSQLKGLNLSDCGLLRQDLITIIELTSYFPTLSCLDLSKNNLMGGGAQDEINIDMTLGNFKNLRRLNLSNVPLRHKGVKELNLANLPRLEEINLSFCLLCDDSISELASCKLNKTLNTLDISSNNLTKNSVKILSDANFEKLQNLNLDWNQIKDEGVLIFSNFKSLKFLNIRQNQISVKALETITNNLLKQLKKKECSQGGLDIIRHKYNKERQIKLY